MAPKKEKPPKKGAKVNKNEGWKKDLENLNINDEKWSLIASIIEPSSNDQEYMYINKYEEAVVESKRFVIKNITKEETMYMIHQLGMQEKKQQDDFDRVYEYAYELLQENKPATLSSEVFAYLIKAQLLSLKKEDLFIKKQKKEVIEGLKHESQTMIVTDEVKDLTRILSVDSVQKGKGKKKGKEKSDTTVIVTEGKKYNTQLRVRGEEWRDKVYVDDFPIEGPDLYVSILGFNDPKLATCLLEIGVPLVSVIKINIEAENVKIPALDTRKAKRGKSLLNTTKEFWDELAYHRADPVYKPLLKNVAFIEFSPPYSPTGEFKLDPSSVYDDISYIMYDSWDLTRQHRNYLKNMKVEPVTSDDPTPWLMDFYKYNIDKNPIEYTTIINVIDGILSTVEAFLDPNIPKDPVAENTLPKQGNISSTEIKNDRLEDFISNVFKCLISPENSTVKNNNKAKSKFEPIIINYGNKEKIININNPNKEYQEVATTILRNLSISKLWETRQNFHENDKTVINYHLHLLLKCFDRKDIEYSELRRLIHILNCEKLYLNKNYALETEPEEVSSNNRMKRSLFAKPITIYEAEETSVKYTNSDETYSIETLNFEEDFESFKNSGIEEMEVEKTIFGYKEIIDLLLGKNVSKSVPPFFDNYEYFEDHTLSSSLQVLHELLDCFNCVEFKYCKLTDSMVCMFYNRYNKKNVLKDSWYRHLVTPVCLEDFFEYSIVEIYDWLQNEEKKYEDSIRMKLRTSKESLVDVVVDTCIYETALGDELLLRGSLKYEEQQKIQSITSNSTSDVSEKLKKETTPKKKKEVVHEKNSSETDSLDISDEVPLAFKGYDLGDRRVEVDGVDYSYLCKDGCILSTNYKKYIPNHHEYQTIKLTKACNSVSVILHRSLNTLTPKTDPCVTITTQNKIKINLIQNSLSIKDDGEMSDIFDSKSNDKEKTSTNDSDSDRKYNSLMITWPNGLRIETVHCEKSSEIIYIKQYFINGSTPPDEIKKERKRCISRVGEVVIFDSDDNLVILKPDGTFIHCTEYELFSITPKPIPVSPTKPESPPKKSPKTAKGKKSKTADLTYRSIPLTEEVEMPPIVYETRFNKYRIVEADGTENKFEKELEEIRKLLIRTAVDYNTGEVFTRREDNTNLLLNNEGMLTVTFPNDTRIASYFTVCSTPLLFHSNDDVNDDIFFSGKINSDDSSLSDFIRCEYYEMVFLNYVVEHKYFATVSMNSSTNEIIIDMPGDISITIDENCNYNIKIDERTFIRADAEQLEFEYESCTKCNAKTLCDMKLDFSCQKDSNEPLVKLKDCTGKIVLVNNLGEIKIWEDYIHEEKESGSLESKPSVILDEAVREMSYFVPHDECELLYPELTQRFFIMKRDLTVSELVHRDVVDNYKKCCLTKTWCSLRQFDVYGEPFRSLLCILCPILVNESEKWILESKFANKPKYLRYKNLKPDTGKGFYKWMRPYERFKPQPKTADVAIKNHLPIAFVIRNLEHLWQTNKSMELGAGKELQDAIYLYMQTVDDTYVADLEEGFIDEWMAMEDFDKVRVANAAQNLIDDVIDEMNDFPYDLNRHKKKREISCKMCNIIKRYWATRATQDQDLQYAKEVLRTGMVPKYFHNPLGGALWLLLNNLVNDVVMKTEEKNHQNCGCVKKK